MSFCFAHKGMFFYEYRKGKMHIYLNNVEKTTQQVIIPHSLIILNFEF